MSDSLQSYALSITLQAPLSMGFSKEEYKSGLSFPSPGYLPNPRIKPGSPTLQAHSLPPEPPTVAIKEKKEKVAIKKKERAQINKIWNAATTVCCTW